MQLLRIVAVTLALVTPVQVWPQSIGIYADIEATGTGICAPVGVPVNIYLTFRETDSPGIVGFELRVVGLPESWLAIEDCGPIGCPPWDWFGAGGSWAWPTCQAGDRVVLRSMMLLATDARENVELQIAARTPPTDPAFDCPLVVRCDGPTYTRQCVAGLRSTVRQIDCPVGIAHGSWTAIKRLYEAE